MFLHCHLSANNNEVIFIKTERAADTSNQRPSAHQPQQRNQNHGLANLPLRPFVVTKQYKFHIIDDDTSIELLRSLLRRADRTQAFSVDLITFCWADEPYHIHRLNIEYNQPTEPIATILVFRTPVFGKLSLDKQIYVKALLTTIFDPAKLIYTWNNPPDHLHPLVEAKLISRADLERVKIIRLDDLFVIYYGQTFPGVQAPAYWYLESAVECMFREVLYPELNPAGPVTLFPVGTDADEALKYHLFECQAITKVSMAMALKWSTEQLYEYCKYHRGMS